MDRALQNELRVRRVDCFILIVASDEGKPLTVPRLPQTPATVHTEFKPNSFLDGQCSPQPVLNSLASHVPTRALGSDRCTVVTSQAHQDLGCSYTHAGAVPSAWKALPPLMDSQLLVTLKTCLKCLLCHEGLPPLCSLICCL